MDRARSVLNDAASVAAGQQIVQMQDLLALAEKNSGKLDIMQDPVLGTALTQLSRALGTDEFQLKLAAKDEVKKVEQENRLAVAVVEVCRELQGQHGDNVPFHHIVPKVAQKLGTSVSRRDIVAAINKIQLLGPGLSLETLANGQQAVRCNPTELSSDQGSVLVACDAFGYVTIELLTDTELAWDRERAHSVLEEMVRQGLLWVDLQVPFTQYWSPSAI